MESIKEIVSPSGKYKALILEKSNCYEIELYVLSTDYDPETDTTYGEYWSRKNSAPIFIDENMKAEHFAINELRILMGESDAPLSIEWVRDYSFCKDANFIDPKDTRVFSECFDSDHEKRIYDEVDVKTIIDFAGLYLVKEVGCEDDWQMGQKDKDGNIICWGYYGRLTDAIKGL